MIAIRIRSSLHRSASAVSEQPKSVDAFYKFLFGSFSATYNFGKRKSQSLQANLKSEKAPCREPSRKALRYGAFLFQKRRELLWTKKQCLAPQPFGCSSSRVNNAF